MPTYTSLLVIALAASTVNPVLSAEAAPLYDSLHLCQSQSLADVIVFIDSSVLVVSNPRLNQLEEG